MTCQPYAQSCEASCRDKPRNLLVTVWNLRVSIRTRARPANNYAVRCFCIWFINQRWFVNILKLQEPSLPLSCRRPVATAPLLLLQTAHFDLFATRSASADCDFPSTSGNLPPPDP